MTKLSNQEIRFVNPFRDVGCDCDLSTDYIKSLFKNKKIVQIILDNCSIQRMERLFEKFPNAPNYNNAKSFGLAPLVDILESGLPVGLSATGVWEMPDGYVKGAKDAYEFFCRSFFRGHKDDPCAAHRNPGKNSNQNKIEFNQLPDSRRLTIGQAYIAMLLIQIIRRLPRFQKFPSERKFEYYLTRIIDLINSVSRFEAEIAKYALWNFNENEINTWSANFQVMRSSMKENFFDSKNSLEACKSAAFNRAMDLYWLQIPSMMSESVTFDEEKFEIDLWLGTNDIKLSKIAEAIYYHPKGGMVVKKYKDQERYSYWKNVDEMLDCLVLCRGSDKSIGEVDVKKIDAAVQVLEGELSCIFKSGSA